MFAQTYDDSTKKAVPLHTTVVKGGEEVQLLLILDLSTRYG
jgi:hypothetical protein